MGDRKRTRFDERAETGSVDPLVLGRRALRSRILPYLAL